MPVADWIDREEYPFTSRFLPLPAGRMHYLDEGQGRPVVLVHGTPDWSFGYRHLVRELSRDFHTVAPDNLGFGLSEKPQEYAYHPREQAENLHRLIEHLELKEVTLLLHDFGGPMGLAYAIEHPENVRGLVLMNTWMWSLKSDAHFERFGKLMGGALGRFLYLRLGLSARVLLKQAFGDRTKLTPQIHAHYLWPLATPEERVATWAYARALLGASDWYDTLWQRRERIAALPTLLLWGMKDIAFREKELLRLESLFARSRTLRFPSAGHFLQEEKPQELIAAVRAHMADLARPAVAATAG